MWYIRISFSQPHHKSASRLRQREGKVEELPYWCIPGAASSSELREGVMPENPGEYERLQRRRNLCLVFYVWFEKMAGFLEFSGPSLLGSSGRGLATWTTGIYTTYHVSYALVVIGTSKKAIEWAKRKPDSERPCSKKAESWAVWTDIWSQIGDDFDLLPVQTDDGIELAHWFPESQTWPAKYTQNLVTDLETLNKFLPPHSTEGLK